jgi:site-specific recombinase XerD
MVEYYQKAKRKGKTQMQSKIEEFLTFMRVEKNCSGKTLTDYRGDLEQFANEMEVESINQITKQRVRNFLAVLVENKAKPATRNRKLTALRSFCKFLCAEEYLDKNPVIDIAYAKVEKRLPKVMTVETTVAVLDSADENPRDKAALETLYGTGCRVDELAKIKIADIDFAEAKVRLIGKGNKERIVPIAVGALVAIVDYMNVRDSNSQWLFPSPMKENSPLTTKTMYNIVVRYGKANGIDLSPHKFRHSIATHLLSNGMDIRKIQELLGHENINTTTIYAQVAIEQMASQFHSAHPRG